MTLKLKYTNVAYESEREVLVRRRRDLGRYTHTRVENFFRLGSFGVNDPEGTEIFLAAGRRRRR